MKQKQSENLGCIPTLVLLGFSMLIFGPLSVIGFLLFAGFLALFTSKD